MRKVAGAFWPLKFFLLQPIRKIGTLKQVNKASQFAYGSLPPPSQRLCYQVKLGLKPMV